MRTLTDPEKRTIRIAAVGLALYLGALYGPRVWRQLTAGGERQQALAREVQAFQRDLLPYENRLLRLDKLKSQIQLDPARLPSLALVAEASAAIQNSAMASGIKLGPIRETAGRPSANELASMRLEALGPMPALLGWLGNLENLRFPLVVDTVQIEADPRQPNMLKLSLTVVIVDFAQWKDEGRRNA
jgi:hypothetical protein